MFMHIATNIKDMDKLKNRISSETSIDMKDYKIQTYNLTDILMADDNLKTELLEELYQKLLKGREMNILVVLFYDKKEDIKNIDCKRIIINNCFIIDSNM